MSVYDGEQRSVFSTRTNVDLASEKQKYSLKVESHYLSDGEYSMFIALMDQQFHPIDVHDHVCKFVIVRVAENNPAFPGDLRGCVFPKCSWTRIG